MVRDAMAVAIEQVRICETAIVRTVEVCEATQAAAMRK
jgi:hypothetical protein